MNGNVFISGISHNILTKKSQLLKYVDGKKYYLE